MPMIGIIDSQRARMITDKLLAAIRRSRALVAVLDFTGVPSMDEAVADHLSHAVNSAQLMGTNLIISGVSEPATRAMQWLKTDRERFQTVCDLQAGIDAAEKLLRLHPRATLASVNSAAAPSNGNPALR